MSRNPAPSELGELHLRRLLVAVDGSASSQLALRAAITVARRDHAAVTLISIEPDLATTTAQWAILAGAPADLQDAVHQQAQAALDAAVAAIPPDIPVTTILRRGRPGPQIVNEAARGTYDAILLGARGVGRVGSLLGSVSHHVLHHAAIAVFVAHAPSPPEDRTE
jgi:nucleotide-binding universal stress UspA family protein